MGASAMCNGPAWNLNAIYPVVSVAVKVMNRDGHPDHDVVFVYLSMNRIRDGHPGEGKKKKRPAICQVQVTEKEPIGKGAKPRDEKRSRSKKASSFHPSQSVPSEF
ncbi:hypothetical protein SDJN03_06927, partial [Cucurbita argyrosperma subsp. sororia]